MLQPIHKKSQEQTHRLASGKVEMTLPGDAKPAPSVGWGPRACTDAIHFHPCGLDSLLVSYGCKLACSKALKDTDSYRIDNVLEYA